MYLSAPLRFQKYSPDHRKSVKSIDDYDAQRTDAALGCSSVASLSFRRSLGDIFVVFGAVVGSQAALLLLMVALGSLLCL